MLNGILSSIVMAIVNALLGRFFPGHPKVTSEVVAQSQRDRADTLQSQKTAGKEADEIRNTVGNDLRSRPVDAPDGGVFKHDANERP